MIRHVRQAMRQAVRQAGRLMILATACLFTGCEASTQDKRAEDSAAEPIGLQFLRVEPELKDTRFNTLLGFEVDTDAVFVAAEPARPATYSEAHSGQRALTLASGTQRFVVKLPSLMVGRAFPGDWTLAGAYLYPESDTKVSVAYVLNGATLAQRTLTLPGGQWTDALLDLSGLTDPNVSPPIGTGELVFDFGENGAASPVYVDDVLVIDNSEGLIDVEASTGSGEAVWTLRRRGFAIHGERPGAFMFALDTPEKSPDGWEVVEANALRARFHSEGRIKSLTVYRDGRAYWDGQYKPMHASGELDDEIAQQHAAPADIEISEEIGRLDRASEGDSNNDGYNELTGAFRIVAASPRLQFKLLPRSGALVRPVFEIESLPRGKAVVTVEGRLVEESVRLDDGTLLVELPIRAERATSISVRVQ